MIEKDKIDTLYKNFNFNDLQSYNKLVPNAESCMIFDFGIQKIGYCPTNVDDIA